MLMPSSASKLFKVRLPAEPHAFGARPKAGSPEAEALRKLQQERLTQALNKQPDRLFVLDRGAATGGGESTAATTLARDNRIAASTAWRSKQVYYLDPPAWYVATGGYSALLHSARSIHQALTARH